MPPPTRFLKRLNSEGFWKGRMMRRRICSLMASRPPTSANVIGLSRGSVSRSISSPAVSSLAMTRRRGPPRDGSTSSTRVASAPRSSRSSSAGLAAIARPSSARPSSRRPSASSARDRTMSRPGASPAAKASARSRVHQREQLAHPIARAAAGELRGCARSPGRARRNTAPRGPTCRPCEGCDVALPNAMAQVSSFREGAWPQASEP